MSEIKIPYQQGAILHDAILGALKASDRTMGEWCEANGITRSVAVDCTFGRMRGARGHELLASMIAFAGPEVVRVGYETRLLRHVAELGLVA